MLVFSDNSNCGSRKRDAFSFVFEVYKKSYIFYKKIAFFAKIDG